MHNGGGGCEADLVGVAIALGAARSATQSGRLDDLERACVARASRASDALARSFHERISRGEDPLGEALCALRSREERRALGATYTPDAIVSAMTTHGARRPHVRVVDPGAGSGRFVVAAGRAMPRAELLAVEIDPVASLLARGHLAAAGLSDRARVVRTDFRHLKLPRMVGSTLFLGNPPYVRHHAIATPWKEWLRDRARSLGLEASGLAGLHAHFFLATALHGSIGDEGAFVTAAEWLDVNYGSIVRQLLLGPLGGESIHVIEPAAMPFADATTTAAITCFRIGAQPATLRLRRVVSSAALAPLHAAASSEAEERTSREALTAARRWTPFTRARAHAARARPSGFVELGELCRVHRGQATGANRVWIASDDARDLPGEVLFACVTRARELFDAGGALRDARRLRRVIDLPEDLGCFAGPARRAIDRFLRTARGLGAHEGFLARHRRPWWSVGLREPAPILATYMARRPPAFVRNVAGARHINVAHGVYPREPMSPALLDALARHLATETSTEDGRTYAGGLTKFEPREMERLLVPAPALLAAAATV
jgi:hypothetical protein